MAYYITIDGGTTNTRISLVKDEKSLDTVKLKQGSGSARGRELLKTAVKEAIAALLTRNRLTEGDVERILASGMITSEFGLYTLPHLTVPAGLDELHQSMEQVALPEISAIPFVFLRGVKMGGESFESADMMRGEETELMGIVDTAYGACIYVLPGSHSKIIRTDATGRVARFSTMLTGEMVAALSGNTILRDAVDLSVERADKAYLLQGYHYCKSVGINQALFKTRVLKNLFGCSPEQAYGFFLGAVLCGEIEEILRDDAKTVVIGGRAQLKEAMGTILTAVSDKRVILLSREAVECSVIRGMLRIYHHT